MKNSAKTAAIGVVGAAALNEPVQAGASKTGKISLKEKNDKWQSYVDSGFYPARTHLFLDDLYIDKMDGIQRVMESPKKVGDKPVIKSEKPWEGVAMASLRNSVLYDPHDKVFKFWYRCHDKNYGGMAHGRWAYATSGDGVNWEKPELGLIDFKGSKKNNLVSITPTLDTNALLMNVFRDDRDPDPKKRFKALGMDAHLLQEGEIEVPYLRKTGFPTAGGLFVAYSADGVRWKMKPGWLMGMICRDGSLLHGYNEDIGKWVLWQRPSFSRGRRIIGVSYSDDFERWTPPQMGLVTDEKDPPGFEYYEMVSAASPDGGYIGLVGCSGWKGQGLYGDESMPQLVYARDPRKWTRVSREPFMRQGPDGAFDEGVVMPMRPLTVGDEIYLFYYAKNRGHTWGEPTTDGKGITTSSLGLAKMTRDRWVSLTPTAGAGSVTTGDIFFVDKELHINANAAGGSIRVEIQDYFGKPVHGYTLDDCNPISTDTMDQVVTWKGGRRDLTQLIGTAVHYPPKVGRTMRIRFQLENAKLYSFSC